MPEYDQATAEQLDYLAQFTDALPEDDRDEFRAALEQTRYAIDACIGDVATESHNAGRESAEGEYPDDPETCLWEHQIIGQVSDWLDDVMSRQGAEERCQFCDTPSRRHHPDCIVTAVL